MMSFVTNKHFVVGFLGGVVALWIYQTYVHGKVVSATSQSG